MESPKVIYVKGVAGLGNRLFTINAAVDLAEKAGYVLHIDWTDGQFLPPHEDAFDFAIELRLNGTEITCGNEPDLQNDSPFLKPGRIYEVASQVQPAQRIHSGRWAAKLPGRWSRWHTCWKINGTSTPDIFAPWSKNHLEYGGKLDPRGFGKVVPFLDYFPTSNRNCIKERFFLKPSMEKVVDSFVDAHHLGLHGIGLHIRATDKQPTASLDRVKRHLTRHHSDQPLFLATDNLEIAEWVEQWHSRVVRYSPNAQLKPSRPGQGLHQIHVESGDYTGVESMYKASIADMWILSRCKTLFYQGNSSFSLFSKYLHHDQRQCIDWQTL